MATLIFGRPVIGIYRKLREERIRLRVGCNLIFFVCGLLAACHRSEDSLVTIRWNGKRATGIAIPRQWVQSVSVDSVDQLLAVHLADKQTPIAGHYQQVGNEILFQPLIPFTRGLSYVICLRNKRLHEFTIPRLPADDHPTLLAIYPSQDSLPDNLLKVYLRFSRPMREGKSQQYVAILKNNTDTLSNVFLDLQPELWNADRTMLTLWLDPGRIKRDLQPNKRLGAPLQTGVRYQLVVSADWPDEQGAALNQTTTKTFMAIQRDSLSPTPAQWTMKQPQPGSVQPLEVAFGEALDYSLLTEALHVLDENGQAILGKWRLGDEEKRAWFKPDISWQTGWYRLRIEGRLEDLAGNNLNRPFDRDVTRRSSGVKDQPFMELPFRVR